MDNAAFLNSQVACAMIEAMGMQATNERNKCMGLYPGYIKDDFDRLIEKYGIGYNSAMTSLIKE